MSIVDAGAGPSNSLWLGEPARYEIDPRRFKPGVRSIDVECRRPCYATLIVDFEDESYASLAVTLDAVGGN